MLQEQKDGGIWEMIRESAGMRGDNWRVFGRNWKLIALSKLTGE